MDRLSLSTFILTLSGIQTVRRRTMRCIVFIILIIVHVTYSVIEEKLELSELKKAVTDLQSKVRYLESRQKLCERAIKRTDSRVTKRVPETDVAFSASLPNDLSGLSVHRHIEYSREVIDTSDSYNPSDGIFSAPVSGIYVFTWSVSCSGHRGNGDWQSTELVVDGTAHAFSFVDSDSVDDYGSTAQTVIVKVHRGQHVWIRTGSDGTGRLDGHNHNTFSGWLLFLKE